MNLKNYIEFLYFFEPNSFSKMKNGQKNVQFRPFFEENSKNLQKIEL